MSSHSFSLRNVLQCRCEHQQPLQVHIVVTNNRINRSMSTVTSTVYQPSQQAFEYNLTSFVLNFSFRAHIRLFNNRSSTVAFCTITVNQNLSSESNFREFQTTVNTVYIRSHNIDSSTSVKLIGHLVTRTVFEHLYSDFRSSDCTNRNVCTFSNLESTFCISIGISNDRNHFCTVNSTRVTNQSCNIFQVILVSAPTQNIVYYFREHCTSSWVGFECFTCSS